MYIYEILHECSQALPFYISVYITLNKLLAGVFIQLGLATECCSY